MSFARFPGAGVERCVQVADVAVDRADAQSRAVDDGGNRLHCLGIQYVRHMVTDAGERAEVDFLEAEATHGVQGCGQVLVAEADR
ncbi:hypothetical protein GCM10010212_34740 [Paenarthrobacter nicotinovorans]|nr:hypothetical protein GCM10010212_34740 [Paenarthrobacter nicotinovorans]